MKFEKISSRVFSLICLLGFLLQVEQVSELYFRFQTTSRTMYQIRQSDYFQSIMYCPRFADLIDKSAMKIEQNPDSARKTLRQYLIDLDIAVSKLTIKDILDLTPSKPDIIKECMVRKGDISIVTHISRQECERFFKVKKSVNGERICYTFIPRTRQVYSVGRVATSSTYPGIVYHIVLKRKISRSIVAMFISSPFIINENGSSQDPLHSRPFVANLYDIKTFNRSMFSVYEESIEIHRLPAPYDTRCTPGDNQELCHENCLNEKLKAINKLPWSGFHKDPISIGVLRESDLQNQTISNYINSSFKECFELCKQKSECFTRFTRTSVALHDTDIFSIASMLPSLPHMLLHAVPSLNPVEYIIQIGSCFGMWFGLSIISFNPMKLKILRNKHSSKAVTVTPKRLFSRTQCNRQK